MRPYCPWYAKWWFGVSGLALLVIGAEGPEHARFFFYGLGIVRLLIGLICALSED